MRDPSSTSKQSLQRKPSTAYLLRNRILDDLCQSLLSLLFFLSQLRLNFEKCNCSSAARKMFKSFLPSLKGIKHERVRYSVACSTSSTISEGLNEYFKIKKLDLFAFSRNACFYQRPLKQFWLKRNHSQVDRVDTSSSASSLKTTFLLYEKSFIRCKMQILLLVFGRVETSCLKA